MRGWAVVFGAVLLISGCAGGAQSAEQADDSGAIVEASAYRSRDDDARGGRFQITVTNFSDATITLQSVQFRSPGFAETEPSQRELTMGPGARLDVPVTFGAADCAAQVQPIEAVVDLLDDDGEPSSQVVALDQPYDIIDRIHNEECAAQRLAERLDLTFTVDDAVLPAAGDARFPQRHATLLVGRVDPAEDDRGTREPVRIDEVAGSVLWGVVADPAVPLPLTMRADAAELRVPLLIGPVTCVDHAVADSKKPFVFPVWIAFGDGDPEYARIPVDDATRHDLSTFLGRVCHGS